MEYKLYTADFCKGLTDRGYIVQASIFPAPYEAIAQRNGITYQLTDFSIMPTHKPIATAKGKIDAKSQAASWRWACEEELERGALTLDIEFEGEIEVVMNGGRKYTLKRDKMGKDIIGDRFFGKGSQVEVSAKPGATVKKATAKVYKY